VASSRTGIPSTSPALFMVPKPTSVGLGEAPRNVMLDGDGQEFMFRQPTTVEEIQQVIGAAFAFGRRCGCKSIKFDDFLVPYP
jgi:hypothetical protein